MTIVRFAASGGPLAGAWTAGMAAGADPLAEINDHIRRNPQPVAVQGTEWLALEIGRAGRYEPLV